MIIDKENDKHIIAEEGKVFQRISDNVVMGKEIWLGYTYYLNGEKLNEPILELSEHFCEVDEPVEDEIVLDDDTVVMETPIARIGEYEEELSDEEPSNEPTKNVVTLADYRELERKVELLMQMTGGMI